MKSRIFRVEENGKARRAGWGSTRDGSRTWYSLNGRSWSVENSSSISGRKSRSSTGSAAGGGLDDGWIRATMPGKVVKIAVESGQAVAPGDLVVILEAMKMEYTLKSAQAGVVQSISVAVGEMVQLGQALVEIKE